MTRFPSWVIIGIFGRCCSWMRLRAPSCVMGANLRSPPSSAETIVLRAPAAMGAAAVRLRNFRLETSGMIESPFRAPHLFVQGAVSSLLLRHQYVVACCLDVPQGHHGVVFVDHVMTVDRILMQPIAEAEEQLNPLVGMQLRDVLPSRVCGHGWSDSVACQDPVLLQVNVNGMRP